MHKGQKTAIVLGATGLVGGLLLDLLLKDARYGQITVISRRELAIKHPKLQVVVTDLFKLSKLKENFVGDEVYCCIGTTKAKTPDRETYRKIDYGIPVAAAKLCRKNNIGTLIVISAMGADKKSKIFYNRIKGEMETAVLQEGVAKTHLVRPGLIGGKRQESRMAEDVGKFLMRAASFIMVGPLKKYRSILPRTIAGAMIWLANNPCEAQIIPSETLKTLAAHGTS